MQYQLIFNMDFVDLRAFFDIIMVCFIMTFGRYNILNDYNFGNFVCELREKNGLTQADIASKLGVTPAAVSKWENGSSKPRVEVLFELAAILGVRPEELMAGKYLEDGSLDAQAVKQINERYEYLCRIDSYATSGVKLRRIAAWIIDWNISGFLTIAVFYITAFILYVSGVFESETPLALFAMLFIMLGYPVSFMLRDVVGGRSVGKRIMGLAVLDRQTAGKTSVKQRIMRNIFSVVLAQIDVVVLLIRGESIGDTLAHTAVVLKKDIAGHEDRVYTEEVDIEKPDEKSAPDKGRDLVAEARARVESGGTDIDVSKINSYKAPKPASGKMILIFVVSLALAFILFFMFVFTVVTASLKAETSTPEYRMAYDYLINSEAFARLDADESDIKFNSYSSSRTKDENGDDVYEKEFGFEINVFHRFNVICHNDGEEWYVCTECTHFE